MSAREQGHTTASIGALVIDVIGRVTGAAAADITMDAHLVTDLGCDELDQVELVMELEEAFGLAFDEETADGFTHVRDVCAYLQRELAPAQKEQ